MKIKVRSNSVNDLYSVVAAGKYLSVSRSMIYYWVKLGLLKFRTHKITGKKYFLRWDLDRLRVKLEKKD